MLTRPRPSQGMDTKKRRRNVVWIEKTNWLSFLPQCWYWSSRGSTCSNDNIESLNLLFTSSSFNWKAIVEEVTNSGTYTLIPVNCKYPKATINCGNKAHTYTSNANTSCGDRIDLLNALIYSRPIYNLLKDIMLCYPLFNYASHSPMTFDEGRRRMCGELLMQSWHHMTAFNAHYMDSTTSIHRIDRGSRVSYCLSLEIATSWTVNYTHCHSSAVNVNSTYVGAFECG